MTTHAFSFPEDARDIIDKQLRASAEAQQPIRSVRTPVVKMEEELPKTVKVQPAPATPMASAEAISVDLPSKFHYYDFKDLYIRPIRLPQLAKISKAHETGSLQTQAEAISSLLSTSSGNQDNLAFRLTMADYQAVLYWLRLVSFSKPQMRVTSQCTNAQHMADVKAGLKEPKSLEIQTVVTKSDIQVNPLVQVPSPDQYHIVVEGERIDFTPEVLADTVEFLDHESWADEEFQYKSRIAAVLDLARASGQKWTWDQRVRFVDEKLTPDQALLAIEFADMLDSYGIVEAVTTKCMGCGSKEIVKITCDPLSFLSPKF